MLATIIDNPGGPTCGNGAVSLLSAWPSKDGKFDNSTKPADVILYPFSGGGFS